jgi:hypothetical protein
MLKLCAYSSRDWAFPALFLCLEEVMRTLNLQINQDENFTSLRATYVRVMTRGVCIWSSSVQKLFKCATLICEARHRNETDR